MIQDLLPPGLRMSNDVKELVLEACNEFVQCVASEANEISTADNKSTIAPEHVVRALESLDFAGYVGEVTETWSEMKSEGKEARAEKKKKKGMQMTPEEALAIQQRMFAEARARYNSGDSSGASAGGPGGSGLGPPGAMGGPPQQIAGGAMGAMGAGPSTSAAPARPAPPIALVAPVGSLGEAPFAPAPVSVSVPVPVPVPDPAPVPAPAPMAPMGTLGSLD